MAKSTIDSILAAVRVVDTLDRRGWEKVKDHMEKKLNEAPKRKKGKKKEGEVTG